MVAVTQPDVPGQRQLPFTIEEVRKIEKRVPHLVKLGTSESPASVANVLHHLSDTSIAHFACHGIQHPTSPIKSALLLSGERMTISALMKHSMPYASLAFLSACETAKGDETVPDDALHLAATMLFTGFRGVVGTMWFVFKFNPRQILFTHYLTTGPFVTMMPHTLQIYSIVTYFVMGQLRTQMLLMRHRLCISPLDSYAQ
jgi:CHAT domain-containing protein